jgi:hypothetical protein
MRAAQVDRKLREADRFSTQDLEGLELGPAEAALAEAIVAEPADDDTLDAGSMSRPIAGRRRRGLVGVAGLAGAVVAAAVIVLVLGGGASRPPSPAYGAELVRFAESTPLLLLEEPGWRVQNVFQIDSREGPEGSMEFVTGPPIPYESTTLSADDTVSGMAPKAVRQRKVELSWRKGELAFPGPPAPVVRPVPSPVLDTTALVNTRAEGLYISTRAGQRRVDLGGPGDRRMIAIWKEDGVLLEMRAWVSNLADFEDRLDWLARVDSEAWLDAMPAKVVKAADHDATVREMLKGIPVPATFKLSRVPDEGLTTNRYQVGGAVTGTVSCLWFRQWGEARRTGDRAAELEAERAMATSGHWPILREMAKDGAYPLTIWQLAAAMPSGEWRRGWRLLPQAEGLGCARKGIPVLPWKQRRQNERAEISGRPLDLRP